MADGDEILEGYYGQPGATPGIMDRLRSFHQNYIAPWGSARAPYEDPGNVGRGVQAAQDALGKLGEAMPAHSLDAAMAVMPGAKMPLPHITNPIKAYHGSPHDFDKFDAAHIGKGEGNQAYGHGLYFAEAEGVARDYKKTLAAKFTDINRETLAKQAAADLGESSRYMPWAVLKELEAGTPIDRVWRKLMDDPMHWRRPPDEVNRAIDYVKTKFPDHAAVPGRMYEVALHATPEQFLDWDKPLSGQSEAVTEALRNAAPKFSNVINPDVITGALEGRRPLTVQDLVRGTQPHSAPNLREAGIPGIRYKDQLSRSPKGWIAQHPQGGINDFPSEEAARAFVARNPEHKLLSPAEQQTHNYVVFPGNEQIIEIMKKYGVAAPVAAQILEQYYGDNRGETDGDQ